MDGKGNKLLKVVSLVRNRGKITSLSSPQVSTDTIANSADPDETVRLIKI